MSLLLSCFTSTGKVRQENQDACALPLEGTDTTKWGALLAAADGVGGVPGGAAASQSAVWLLQALYYAQVGHPEAYQRLRACFEMVNTLNRFGAASGLTTLVAAAVKDDWLWVANVGDSRAYLIEAASGTRRQLTEDHSSQVLARKQRNAAGGGDDSTYLRIARSEITRAIGMSERVEVDTYRYTWALGDALVLCSDGLMALPEAEMVHLALTQPPEQAAKMMVERAVELDGSDNTTVVLARRMPPEGGAQR
jgi:protein phosphatase